MQTTSFALKKGYYYMLFLIFAFLLFCIMALSATVGTAEVGFLDAFRILLSRIPFISEFADVDGISDTHIKIVLSLRVPRILLAGLIGAGLSVCGAVYQGLFKNPMADPYVLGVSSGAALGASVAIVLGVEYFFWGLGGISILAFLFSLATVIFVYSVAKSGVEASPTTLLLTGIAVSFLMSSTISLLMIFNREHVERIVFWLMGSVAGASLREIYIVFPVVLVGVGVMILFSRDLNIIVTGDDTSRGLGIEVEKVKKICLGVCSVVIAVCVCFSGIIGFVGLVVPHVFRMIFGPDHRIILPFAFLGGAIFMVVSDMVARGIVPPMEIPVGVITAMVGAPYFIFLVAKQKKRVC